MSLRKRGGTWWIDFVTPSGERIRRPTGTADRNLAQEFHDRLKAQSWRIDRSGDRIRRTWNEAVVKWLKESSHKATLGTDKAHLRWLDRFLDGKYLDEISRSFIDRITDARLAEDVSNATVNRTLEVLRAILRRCVQEWEWLDRAPRVGMLKEPTRRVRFLTREEADRLLTELPTHLADMTAFSLATGLRRSNVTGLQWTMVDPVVVIIRQQDGKHPTHVFSYQGKPIRQVSTKGWYAALERACIHYFRWHDLRHTWASWHVQNGTPLHALQELGGWESPEMVRRYAHFSAEHLAPYADRLCALRLVAESANGTNLSQAGISQRASTANSLR